MRRLTRTLLFGTVAAAFAANLWAQHTGGHSSGASSTARSIGSVPSGIGLVPSGIGPSYRGSSARGFGSNNYRSGAYGGRGAYNRNYRALPYAYWLAPYYFGSPDYGDPGYGAAGYDPQDDPGAQAAMMAQNALIDQVQRLSAQVAQMQGGQQMPVQINAAPEAAPPQGPPVTLVLHSGQQLQVQNYAIMGQTFWDFSSQPTRKIPLSSIDVAASTRATEAQGGEFPQI